MIENPSPASENPESFLAHMLKGLFRELVNPPPPIQQLAAAEVMCPYCQADPNQPCVTATSGVVIKGFHRDRNKHVHIKSIVDSGVCLNKLCTGGKVWARTETIDCPSCAGTGRTQPGFWDRFST